MSVLPCPDAISGPDLQIWNNAAFDSGDSYEAAAIKDSWCPLQSIFVNRSESLEVDSSKENQSPAFCKSPISVKSPVPVKLLHPNSTTEKSQGKPLKLLFKQGVNLPTPITSKTANEAARDDSKIDTEIEEIEKEISRLSSKLEALRLEKAERNLKKIEKRGRIVPAKFMEQKQSSKNSATARKIEEPQSTTTNTKFRRRGVTLGPSEIIAGVRPRQTGKLEITPIQSIQNRRKSCFWKLQEIEEDKVTKHRGRSLSSSPKSRLSISKIQASKQGFTTVGSKKSVKRDDGLMSCIQPKKLFKEGEKSVPIKKPSKPGRVVASRYNQIPAQSSGNLTNPDRRKRSLPENDKDDIKRCDKKRASADGKSDGFHTEPGQSQVNETQVKKRWEIPSEAAMDRKNSVDGYPTSILKLTDLVPKIRIVRCTNESPRDSGPAKRVAELIGRKSYFEAEESELETSVCQALSFDEEDD